MNKTILLGLILALHVGACRIEANSTVLPPHTLSHTLLPVAMHNLTPPINITSTLQKPISWSLPHFSPAATWWTGMATLCAIPVVLFFMRAKLFNTYYRLKLFLTLDSNINAQDKNKLLHYAVENNSSTLVKLTLALGADITAKNGYGLNALHLAARSGHKDVVETLIKNGAADNINAQDNDGWTALHFAALNDYKDIVETLINNGADKTAKTKEGYTLYDLASEELKKLLDPKK